jgi:hypothetical protein
VGASSLFARSIVPHLTAMPHYICKINPQVPKHWVRFMNNESRTNYGHSRVSRSKSVKLLTMVRYPNLLKNTRNHWGFSRVLFDQQCPKIPWTSIRKRTLSNSPPFVGGRVVPKILHWFSMCFLNSPQMPSHSPHRLLTS